MTYKLVNYLSSKCAQYKTLHYTTLHYTTLHYTTLHYTTLHYTTLHYTALHCTALHCTALHCTALHCTALHYTTLQYTTLHYNTLHYNAVQCNAIQQKQCNAMLCNTTRAIQCKARHDKAIQYFFSFSSGFSKVIYNTCLIYSSFTANLVMYNCYTMNNGKYISKKNDNIYYSVFHSAHSSCFVFLWNSLMFLEFFVCALRIL